MRVEAKCAGRGRGNETEAAKGNCNRLNLALGKLARRDQAGEGEGEKEERAAKQRLPAEQGINEYKAS